MGLVFGTISMVLGIIMGDVMSANVAAFTVWCMSSLFGGLYFPMEYTTGAIRTLSYIIPHKWFVEGVEMILVGDNSVYFMLICITVAYLIVTISLGYAAFDRNDMNYDFETMIKITDAALYNIINSRLTAHRKTIISTNLRDSELQKRYGAQICSRLFGMFERVPFVGRDIRLLKR